MPVGKPLRLRLFLEGQEVPVVSAQVTAGVNAPAVSAIQIVPLDEGMEFYPRTMVHLFFLDTKTNVKPASITSDILQNPSESSLFTDYKLLFSGEIVGFSMAQAPSNRALILQCLDFSSYWDAAHATAIEYGPGGNALTNKGSLYGGSTGIFDDIANHMQEKLMGWLSKKPSTPGLQNVGGLAGGIISMLEAMGGVPGHFKGVNDFFTASELRCRILNQIVAEENDNTASKILNAKVMDQWVRNGLQNIGLQVTFRDLMKLLFQYIYYEFVPNPAAMWVPTIPNGTKKTVPGVTSNIASAPTVQGAVSTLTDAKTRLDNAVTDGSYDQDAINNASKVALGDIKLATSNLHSLSSSTPQFGQILSQINNALTKANVALQPYSNGTTTSLSGFSNASQAIQDALSIIANAADTKITSKSTVQSLATSQRLRSQVIKPDCWFVPPPKCNVIFPEMYTQFTYERNYLQETTRTLMQFYNTLVGPDALLSTYILVPNIGVSTKGITKYKPGQDYRILMDHEIHTGIIPRWERLSNMSAVGAKTNPDARKQVRQARISWGSKAGLFHFFKYRFGPRQMGVSMRFNPVMVCGFPAVLIRKPFIIPGVSFASSSSDQDVIDYVTNSANDLGAPAQLVGMVGSLVHNVDQAGGTTSVQMHHVRQHTGTDDEFLVQYAQDPTIKQKIVKTIIQYSTIQSNPQLLKLLVGCTPQTPAQSTASPTTMKSVTTSQAVAPQQVIDQTSGTVTTQNQTFTTQNVTETPATNPNTDAPLTNGNGTIAGANLNRTAVVPNPNGVIKPQSKSGIFAAQSGIVLGVEVLDPTLVQIPGYGQAFSAVALYEQVAIEFTTLPPFEDLVRPTWFSPNYANVNIGNNIYQPFFGCASIVDDLVVSGLTTENPAVLTTPDTQNFTAIQTPTEITQSLQNVANSNYALSTETAVNFIGYIYGQIKVKGLDVDQFIKTYTDRPIATKDQVLGSDDLQMSYDSSSGSATVTQGQAGFFSAAVYPAFADAGNFAGLLFNPGFALPRISKTGKKGTLDPRLDIRQSNLQQVLDYLEALESHAFIG